MMPGRLVLTLLACLLALAAAAQPTDFRAQVRAHIRRHGIDVVVGFGGYASAPAYVAARREGVPFVVHEANAKPGLANVLGARRAAAVGVAFEGTPLRGGEVVGMPLRQEVIALDAALYLVGTTNERVAGLLAQQRDLALANRAKEQGNRDAGPVIFREARI